MRRGDNEASVIDITDPSAANHYGWSLGTDVIRPVTTGIPTWNSLCEETDGRGLGDWWYVIMGGASNVGKTRLALHMLREASLEGHQPSLVSLESPTANIQRMFYANVTSFGYHDLVAHKWERDWQEKTDRLKQEIAQFRAREDMMGASLYVMEHKRKPTLRQIMDDVDSLAKIGSRLIIVDHLQLVKAPVRDVAEAATEVSEALREYAHDRRVCIVGLSQLNRMASRDFSRTPNMYDLFGGTGMESNADQVFLLDHTRQQRDMGRSHLVRQWCVLDKNRHGPARVEIPVEINFRTGEWREAMDHEVDSWPERK